VELSPDDIVLKEENKPTIKQSKNKKTDLEKLASDLGLDDEFDDFDIDINGSNLKKESNTDVFQKINIVEDSNKEKNMVTLTTPEKTPKNKRTKIKIETNITKLFKIKKTDGISFLDLRKHVMSYVINNKLHDKTDKSLIRLDEKICKTLSLEEGYIKFDDLDKLVSQAYK